MSHIALLTAKRRASMLTIFRGVLGDAIGRGFIDLVGMLAPKPTGFNGSGMSSETMAPEQVATAYGHLFAMLAEEAELYRKDAVGDAWQNHLLDRILADRNAFSLKAERAGWDEMGISLVEAARFDLRSLQSLYLLDANPIARAVARASSTDDDASDPPDWSAFKGVGPAANGHTISRGDRAVLKRKLANADDWGELAPDLAEFYRSAGAGIYGSYRAYRWVHREGAGAIEGIADPDPICLENIIGYEAERALLVQNTEHFIAGYPANNVLLYGDRGTGKSSTVKALLNEYGHRGLRLLEVSKQHLDDFPRILTLLRDRRERFILFVDDLSFEDDETHYKELKAVLEGGLEARPDNVLLYATSNRRHLIRERFVDRAETLDEEIHPGDTTEEKLSLSDRFGIALTFLAPNQERYLAIVRGLAEQRNLRLPREDLEARALTWATQHNARSGRTARQFVDFLSGELGLIDCQVPDCQVP